MKKKVSFPAVFFVMLIFIGVLVVIPLIMFSRNEKELLKAAKHYFELNTSELPSGERVRTLTLNDLYKKAYIKNDLLIPYTNKVCSIDDSWVKVKRVNNEYKYYTYLKCGLFSSRIDHIGPVIKLNGDSEMTIGKGEVFDDPGVNSVKDAVDGKISVDTVTVKGEVNTSEIGSYTVSYVAYDKLANRTVANRVVNVVQKFSNMVKEKLGDSSNYKGNPTDNYVRLSNMLFRIYGVDENNNVLIVSDKDVAYVGYNKLDEWLDYYYDHLNKKTKDMIVAKKYCNETLAESDLSTTTCNSYTKERKVFIPSVDLVNLAQSGDLNFMKPYTMSWVGNKVNANVAYLTREILFENDYNKSFLDYDVKYNLGVRPMFTVRGDKLVVNGDGTLENPYTFGDVKKAKAGTLLNTRYTGEYLSIGGEVYRIIDVEEDGTTKVISDFTIEADPCTASEDSNVIVYNPKKLTSVAYFINNRMASYIDASHFVNHKIKAPIYKDDIVYGEEVETKEYSVKLSAPNMYEMFSAIDNVDMEPYWFLNTSKAERKAAVLYSVIPMTTPVLKNYSAYVRVVAFANKNTKIMNGRGTPESPYLID